MTAQIADALMQHLQPQGSLVVVEAEHMCMKMRGVRKTQPVMTTVAHRGIFSDDRALRHEVLSLLLAGATRSASPLSPWAEPTPQIANEALRLHVVDDDGMLEAAR